MMNCPSCASQILEDQQFCRECGFGLTVESTSPLRPRSWGLLAILIFFAGTVAALFGRMLDLQWLLFIGVFAMLAGLFGLVVVAYIWEARSRRRTPAEAQQPVAIERADRTNDLLPMGGDDYIPNVASIVEFTTKRLKIPSRSNSHK